MPEDFLVITSGPIAEVLPNPITAEERTLVVDIGEPIFLEGTIDIAFSSKEDRAVTEKLNCAMIGPQEDNRNWGFHVAVAGAYTSNRQPAGAKVSHSDNCQNFFSKKTGAQKSENKSRFCLEINCRSPKLLSMQASAASR